MIAHKITMLFFIFILVVGWIFGFLHIFFVFDVRMVGMSISIMDIIMMLCVADLCFLISTSRSGVRANN